jgi:uncharacterized membrane protein
MINGFQPIFDGLGVDFPILLGNWELAVKNQKKYSMALSCNPQGSCCTKTKPEHGIQSLKNSHFMSEPQPRDQLPRKI